MNMYFRNIKPTIPKPKRGAISYNAKIKSLPLETFMDSLGGLEVYEKDEEVEDVEDLGDYNYNKYNKED